MSDREIIAAAYEGFNRRDIEAVLALMDAAVDWPNGMEGGRVLGHEQVREYWTRQWAMIDPHVEPVYIENDEQGNLIVDVHQVVRDSEGNLLSDRRIQHVHRIVDQRIIRMDIRENEPMLPGTT